MRKLCLALTICTCLFFSCKKETAQSSEIVGRWVWTIQYANNPAFNSTPLSTGINEVISFTSDGAYALIQNNVTINSGTYKTSTAISISGETIPTVLYTNGRVTDSVGYYKMYYNNDTLVFSHDFIGTVGSGARYYGRQK